MSKIGPTLSKWHPAMLLATWFGSGFSRYAPGTFGSLTGLPFAWLIATVWGGESLVLAAGLMFCVGCIVCKIVMRSLGEKDPQIIVVDEVAGQWLALSTAPIEPLYYILGFVLFRIADIWKIWPASWIDNTVPGELGVMLDDVIAGAYAAITVFLIVLIAE